MKRYSVAYTSDFTPFTLLLFGRRRTLRSRSAPGDGCRWRSAHTCARAQRDTQTRSHNSGVVLLRWLRKTREGLRLNVESEKNIVSSAALLTSDFNPS